MRWLVTGGCGFIGRNLVNFLKNRGDFIRVMDNLSVGSREELRAVTDFKEVIDTGGFREAGVELLVGDIRDPEQAQIGVRGVDAVVHLAAHTAVVPSVEQPRFDFEQNGLGTFNVLDACRQEGVHRFVMASSAAVLGEQEPPSREDRVPNPLSPYGASKLTGESYCSAFHGSYGISTAALRFSNVYGQYSFNKGSLVAKFFRRGLSGDPLTIYGDGEQTRDFVYAADLNQAIAKAATVELGHEVFQIGTGQETTVNEVSQKICALIERDLDLRVELGSAPARKGEIYRNYADISKARRVLGYEPAYDLDEGLELTWAWFKGSQ